VGTGSTAKQRPTYTVWLWLAALLIMGAFGYLGFREWRFRQWEQIAAKLQSEPGIALTSMERHGNRLRLTGLRDPLARDAAQLLQDEGLPAESFELHLRGYESQDPALASTRTRLAHQEWLRSLNITFEEDSSVISSLAAVQIAEAAKRILAVQGSTPPSKPIVVWGEADGSGERNTNLAQARAEAVSKLLQDMGVPREWISVQSSPVQSPGENITVRKLMRRVALRLDN